MEKKHTAFLIGLLAVIVLISGCITTTKFKSEPKDPTATLVIGRVEFNIKNFESFHGVSVNGVHTKNVQLDFINQSTDEKRLIQSFGENGFFYSTKLEPGVYKIDKVYYRLTSKKARVSIWVGTSTENHVEILRGKVNNLGYIDAARDGSLRTASYDANKDYAETRKLFGEIYYESGWLSYDWTDVEFK